MDGGVSVEPPGFKMYQKRRNPTPKEQITVTVTETATALPMTIPSGVVSAPTSSPGLVRCEILKVNEQEAASSHSKETLENLQAVSCSKLHNVPCSQRSNRRALRKEMMKDVDSDHEESTKLKHPSKTRTNAHQCTSRKRKSEMTVNKSYSEGYTRRFRIRGQLRGQVNCSNSLNQKGKGKMDSKTFECYLENMWTGFSQEKRNSFTYLDSLSFALYIQSSSKEKVLNWMKRKDLFSKQYIFVPIVIWSHRSLLILCHFGESAESKSRSPCMLLLDSMQSMDPKRLEPGIRRFVLDIHKTEDRLGNRRSIDKLSLLIPKAPQQRKSDECGNYVLYYINLFLENAPETFNVSKGYPYFMKEDWFTLEGLDTFCKMLDSIPKDSPGHEMTDHQKDVDVL